MARKNKEVEISIVAGELDTEKVTDLKVFIKEEQIGEIFQEEDDRQIQVSYANGKKGSAISVEEAVHAIIADYNLHN